MAFWSQSVGYFSSDLVATEIIYCRLTELHSWLHTLLTRNFHNRMEQILIWSQSGPEMASEGSRVMFARHAKSVSLARWPLTNLIIIIAAIIITIIILIFLTITNIISNFNQFRYKLILEQQRNRNINYSRTATIYAASKNCSDFFNTMQIVSFAFLYGYYNRCGCNNFGGFS